MIDFPILLVFELISFSPVFVDSFSVESFLLLGAFQQSWTYPWFIKDSVRFDFNSFDRDFTV